MVRSAAVGYDRAMHRVPILGLVLFLAACAGQRGAEQRYIDFCTAQGLQPESVLWTRCIEAQRERDRLETERIRSMRDLRLDQR